MTSVTKSEHQQKAEQVKHKLHSEGMTIRAWALKNDYPVPEVYKIMSGERKGLYGRGHEIATKLGLK